MTPGKYAVADQQEFTGLERFDGVRAHGVPGVHEILVSVLADLVEPGAQVADLGCGSGALTARLKAARYAITAVDLIPDKLTVPGVGFVQANLNEDFAGKVGRQFDVAVASEIIEHLENPRHFLRQAQQIIRPGGHLIVTTPNVDSPFSKAVFLRAGHHNWFAPNDYDESGHITPMGETCLRRALAETGYAVKRVTSGGNPTRSWWKMEALASLLSLLSAGQKGEVLIVVAQRAGA